MMANCSDNVYVIKYTDTSAGTITIAKSSLVTNLVDIALVGKSRLDYGEAFNESLLHLLENFACPASSDDPNIPDTLVSFGTLLENPIAGQKWFNSTTGRMYIYDADNVIPQWVPLAKQGDVAGNSGVIAHGEYIPRPVNKDGYIFPYAECSFIVSQHSTKSVAADTYLPSNTEIDYVKCFVDADGKVTMQFRYRGESAVRNGYVNYQILGIRDEVNTPVVTVTPYPIPSATPGISATPTPTITPTPTPTTSVGSSPTPTPSATAVIEPTPTRTVTPTPTVSLTRTVTPTPTPSPSPVYTIDLAGIPTSLEGMDANSEASVSLDFLADGTWIAKENNVTVESGVWATSGIGGDYELMFVDDGGNYPQGDAGTWYSLSSGFQFYIADAVEGSSAAQNVTYTIRNKLDTSDSRTTTLSMIADGTTIE